jgi:hypothetical protein
MRRHIEYSSREKLRGSKSCCRGNGLDEHMITIHAFIRRMLTMISLQLSGQILENLPLRLIQSWASLQKVIVSFVAA